MKTEITLRSTATFTPADCEHPLLRDLLFAYANSTEHVALPHKLAAGEHKDAVRTVTYIRRTVLESRVDLELRRRTIAELMPDVDVELSASLGGLT